MANAENALDDVDDLATTLFMMLKTGHFPVLAEGERDLALLEECSPEDWHFFERGGRPKVLSTMTRLRAKGVEGLGVFVDDDGDRFVSSISMDGAVSATHLHDLEMLVVADVEVVTRMLENYLQVSDKAVDAGLVDFPAIHTRVLAVAAADGALRLAARCEGIADWAPNDLDFTAKDLESNNALDATGIEIVTALMKRYQDLRLSKSRKLIDSSTENSILAAAENLLNTVPQAELACTPAYCKVLTRMVRELGLGRSGHATFQPGDWKATLRFALTCELLLSSPAWQDLEARRDLLAS